VENFTPLSALAGGALIGASAALLWLLNGRIAGISGILGALLTPVRGEIGWRIAFLVGMLLAPLLYGAAVAASAPATITSSMPLLVGGGLLVGFGTRLGGGCTSGHGVCGVARLSPRSIVATLVFMTAGFVTVFVVRHVLGA
jgi:uncharacterized membrane protein YedE/YeeE